MKVLVTGSTGHLGEALMRMLDGTDHEPQPGPLGEDRATDVAGQRRLEGPDDRRDGVIDEELHPVEVQDPGADRNGRATPRHEAPDDDEHAAAFVELLLHLVELLGVAAQDLLDQRAPGGSRSAAKSCSSARASKPL